MPLEEWLELLQSSSLWQACIHSTPVPIGVADIKELMLGYPLPYGRGAAWFPNMIFEVHVSGSEEHASILS